MARWVGSWPPAGSSIHWWSGWPAAGSRSLHRWRCSWAPRSTSSSSGRSATRGSPSSAWERWPRTGRSCWDLGGLAAAGLAPADLAEQVAAERAECRRRVSAYRSGRRGVPVTGCTVVVVDDGVATGVSARAALRSLRDAGAARLVLAAPVVAAQTMPALEAEADAVVALVVTPRLGAVSRWYADFRQTTDEQVVRLLHGQAG